MKHTHADNLDVDFIQKLTMLLKLLQTPFYSPVFTLHELVNTTRALTLLIQHHKQPYTHTHTLTRLVSAVYGIITQNMMGQISIEQITSLFCRSNSFKILYYISKAVA